MAKSVKSLALPVLFAGIIACSFVAGYFMARGNAGSAASSDTPKANTSTTSADSTGTGSASLREGTPQEMSASKSAASSAGLSAATNAQSADASTTSTGPTSSANADGTSSTLSSLQSASSAHNSAVSSGSENSGAQSEESSTESGASSDTDAETPSSFEEPARDELFALLEAETAERLIANAEKDADAAWVAAHPEAFAVFREHIQVKALSLAADEPLSAAYVRAMPDRPYDDPVDYSAPAMDSKSPSANVPDTKFPHLYQWDRRWGYTPYDGDSFGMSGCGPAALAMVYQGLTGKDDITPYDMGQRAIGNGFVEPDFNGTNNAFFDTIAPQIGLRCERWDPSAQAIVDLLGQDKPIIARVGPGAFSKVGHYFVLTGLEDGKVIINDPYSPTRSAQLWDPELIAAEAITLFAYSLAE